MKIYMAKKGDTLLNVAEKFRVHPESLFELNPHISNPDLIEPGVKVKIPLPPSPLEQIPMEFLYQHEVKPGDTLWKLSKAWNIPLKALISVNPQLRNPNVLKEGELVNVPKLVAEIASAPVENDAGEKQFPLVKVNVKASAKKNNGKDWPVHQESPLYQEAPLYQQAPFLAEEQGWIDQPYPQVPQGMEGNFETPESFWGEAPSAITSNAMNPFETYMIDPRINLPAYPDYEVEGIQQFTEMEPPEEEEAESELPAKRPKRKAKSKGKGKHKPAKGAVAAAASTSVHPQSKPIRRSSKPWTNI